MKFHKLPLITAAIASLSVLACSCAETSNPTAISGSTAQRPASKVEDVQAVSPALEYYSDRVVMGDLWKRPGLSSRDRSVVTVAAISAPKGDRRL